MNKRNYLFFIMLFIFAIVLVFGCQQQSNDDDDGNVVVDDVTVDTFVLFQMYEKNITIYDSTADMNAGYAKASWTYDKEGRIDFSKYSYDDTSKKETILSYSTDVKTEQNDSTQLYKIEYIYNNDGDRVAGLLYEKTETSTSMEFEAEYNANGRYTRYLLTNTKEIKVEEHRTCTYDAVSGQYLVETYYKTDDTSDIICQYKAFYHPTLTTKYLYETRFDRIDANYKDESDDIKKIFFDMSFLYTFTWRDLTNDGVPYMQSKFDESGDLTGVILSTFYDAPYQDNNRKIKSYINDNKTARFVEYIYDEDGFKTAELYYDTIDGEKLTEKIEYRKTQNSDGDIVIEEIKYLYNDQSRSINNDTNSKSKFFAPKPANRGSF